MDHFNQFHQFNQNQNQIPINAVNPDYGEFVIKPPEANNTGGRVPTTLLIDSRDRNYQHYPNPQEYKIDLKRKYFDVVAIELKKGMIPQSGLYINEQNNLIHFNESIADDYLTATIPVGFYTQAELFTAIETAMNDVGDSTYTVSLTVKKQVRIKSDITGGNNYFVLLFGAINGKFPERSMGPLLGFEPKNYVYMENGLNVDQSGTAIEFTASNMGYKFSDDVIVGDNVWVENVVNFDSGITTIDQIDSSRETLLLATDTGTFYNKPLVVSSHVSKAPFCIDDGSEPYVSLHLFEAQQVISQGRGADGAFAIIPFTEQENGCGRNFFGELTPKTGKMIKYFNPPLQSMGQLTISFKKHDGTLYDFRGKEHFLEFDIYELNSKEKYRYI